MLIDWHTHLWLPEHMSAEHAAELGSRTGRQILAGPAEHAAGVAGADRFVVIAVRWLGIKVPNEYIAEYVAAQDGRAIGLACVDPADPGALREFVHAVEVLGLHGLKLSPVYQGFDPWSDAAWPLYEAAAGLGVPIMFHQGGAFPSQSVLEYANPVLLDRIARRFPELWMIVAHFGQPWVAETVQLLRKHERVYADLSARYYRRWQFYTALQLAIDYGVTDRLLFGSDFPMQTTRAARADFEAITSYGSGLPPVDPAIVQAILHDRPFATLGIDA